MSCGCVDQCTCVVTGDGETVEVGGEGSFDNPYVITATGGGGGSGAAPLVEVVSADAVWDQPVGARFHHFEAYGGGGGGGSGEARDDGVSKGGGNGGGQGGYSDRWMAAADVPASLPITIGLGGTGGAPVGPAAGFGLNGANGGRTEIGTDGEILRAGGGVGGKGGSVSIIPAVDIIGTNETVQLASASMDLVPRRLGSSAGGMAGSGASNYIPPYTTGLLPGGGAAGRGVNSSDVPFGDADDIRGAQAAPIVGPDTPASGGNGGTFSDGAPGLTHPGSTVHAGGGGGGGDGSGDDSVDAWDGGDGGSFGGGGGGGGAGTSGGTAVSGAGGNGGDGGVVITTYF